MFFAKKSLGKLLAALIVAAGVAPGTASGMVHAAESGSAVEGFQLRILHTNDTHAHLDNIARRITAIEGARTDNTLLLDAGDVFSGTLYFNQYNGLADLYFMNELGYDAMTFGNHEFDKGPKTLSEFVKQAKFPFVSANLDFSTEPALSGMAHSDIGNPGEAGQIYPSIIKEIGGEQVGIIGLTTPESTALSSPGENIKFADEVQSAQQQVDALEAKGINKIIALTHLGYTVDQKLADAVKGIDIIVGGHSHTQLDDAEVHHADGEPTLIVQTGEYDEHLGQLDVTFNEDGVLTAWKDKLIALDEQDAAGNYVIKSDPAAEAKLAGYAAPLEELKKTVIGESKVELDGERDDVRSKETNLGDLVADGMRAKVESIVSESDAKGYVTIQNGGGIRASIGAGDIALGDLLTTMPFGNNLTALKMTGKEIIAALENGVSGIEDGEGRFPQVSGLRFYYDTTKQREVIDAVSGKKTQEGQRVVKVQLQNNGGTYSDIDPNAYYIVATNSYMADGGDFYGSMKEAKDDGRFYELNLVDYEVFHEYLDKVGTVNISTEERITNLNGAPLPAEAGGSGAGGNGNAGTGTDAGTAPGAVTAPGGAAAVFTDIAGDSNAAAIRQAAAAGIVNGYGNGTFRPNGLVTRAEFAVMVGRAFQLPATAFSAAAAVEFADEADIPVWALPSAKALKATGFLNGLVADKFQPDQTLTVAQAAAVISAASGATSDTANLDTAAAASRSEVMALIVAALQ